MGARGGGRAMVRRMGLAAAGLSLLLLVLVPTPARAADTIIDSAVTTYELVPAKAQIQVTIDLKVTNRTPDTVEYQTCTGWQWDAWLELYLPYSYPCPSTTHWYVDSLPLYIERGATQIRATASGGTASTSTDSSGSGDLITLKVGFPRILNGQTASVRVTYALPGGKPRSGSLIRAGRAYAFFCGFGNAVDSGSVRFVLPEGFIAETIGATLSTTVSGSRTILSSGTLREPYKFVACVDATNPSAYTHLTVTAPGGRAVEIQGWPEDGQWVKETADAVRTSLPALESLIGVSLPGSGRITVREVTQAALGADYAGSFDPEEQVARVSEVFDATTVAHELSHVWFNPAFFSDRWLDEGYASYAEKVAGAGYYRACEAPPAYGGSGAPPALATWKVLGARVTEDDRAAVAYQYAAACWIVTAAADSIGDARMAEVLEAASRHEIAYRGAGTPEIVGSGPIDWRTWLDLVDEHGAAASGLDLPRLLAHYGVTDNLGELAQRAAARSQYLALAARAGGWYLPLAIREPMATWKFGEASAAMTLANAIFDAQVRTTALVPRAAASTKLQQLFESAGDEAALRSAATFAEQRLAAARLVARSAGKVAASRGPVEAVGLVGTDLARLASDATAALAADQLDRATRLSAEIDRDLSGAATIGSLRIGTALAVLLLGLTALTIARHRSRRHAHPATATVDASVPATADAPVAPAPEVPNSQEKGS